MADDGGKVVGPLPDSGNVSLAPADVPVGPVVALALVTGYGAVADNADTVPDPAVPVWTVAVEFDNG